MHVTEEKKKILIPSLPFQTNKFRNGLKNSTQKKTQFFISKISADSKIFKVIAIR